MDEYINAATGDRQMNPDHAPMHDGCSRVARNLENNRPLFEGVDSASLDDMAFYAQVEIQERDPNWGRPDLAAFSKAFEEATGEQPF